MIKEINLEIVLQQNESLAKHYQKSALMQLISSTEMIKKVTRERLLDCVQVFSNYFQKAVMLRYVLCDNQQFLPVSQAHLQEEFAHNTSLDKDRNYRAPVWDAILDATACWFTWKMLTADQEEKTVLIHLVLETSAHIFFKEAHKIMHNHDETDYFKIHALADARHEKMGIELLQGLSLGKYQRLLEVQQQGWEVLYTVCDRIAFLTEQKIKAPLQETV